MKHLTVDAKVCLSFMSKVYVLGANEFSNYIHDKWVINVLCSKIAFIVFLSNSHPSF